MKKPIAKLREDVVKAAMLRHERLMKAKTNFDKFERACTSLRKACAALASRQKRGGA